MDEFLVTDKVTDPASDEPAYQTVTSNIEGNFANSTSNANGHGYAYSDLTFKSHAHHILCLTFLVCLVLDVSDIMFGINMVF